MSSWPSAKARRVFAALKRIGWRHDRTVGFPLRANIAETLLVPLITEQGGKDIQHEEHEDILSGPGRRAQW